MKSTRIVLVSVCALFSTIFFPAISQASTIDLGNFTLTLPDSLDVVGQEVGTNSRNCLFTANLDAKPGFVIPLRGGVVINLVDSLNTTIDNGYSLAEVEGLTHLDIKGVFKCNASSGTLKPPYKFSIIPRGLPSTQVFGYESPVTLKFIESAPAPKPSATPTPSASPTASSASAPVVSPELAEARALINSLQSQIDSLNSRLVLANSSAKLLTSKIEKICKSKPKPKGC
jgi:hypothetical protein